MAPVTKLDSNEDNHPGLLNGTNDDPQARTEPQQPIHNNLISNRKKNTKNCIVEDEPLTESSESTSSFSNSFSNQHVTISESILTLNAPISIPNSLKHEDTITITQDDLDNSVKPSSNDDLDSVKSISSNNAPELSEKAGTLICSLTNNNSNPGAHQQPPTPLLSREEKTLQKNQAFMSFGRIRNSLPMGTGGSGRLRQSDPLRMSTPTTQVVVGVRENHRRKEDTETTSTLASSLTSSLQRAGDNWVLESMENDEQRNRKLVVEEHEEEEAEGSNYTLSLASGTRLAVAVTVHDDDANNEMFLPAAIEWDPDVKDYNGNKGLRSFMKRRKMHIGIITVLIILIASVTTIVLVSKANTNTDGRSNIQASDELWIIEREALGIQQFIASQLIYPATDIFVFNNDLIDLDDIKNPYHKALNWIMYQDPLQLNPAEHSNFLQRFIAAYIYYATSFDYEWEFCSPPIVATRTPFIKSEGNLSYSEEYPDSQWKCKIYDTVIKKNIIVNERTWLTEIHECEWTGVSCDGVGHITQLRLSGMNMTGAYPTGLIFLPFLNFIALSIGNLRGSSHASAALYKHLNDFYASMNQLTGDVMSTWLSSRNIKVLHLEMNALTGSLPEMIHSLRDIASLYIHENYMTGKIPDNLVHCSGLDSINFANNELNGSIPTLLFTLPKLHIVSLKGNALTGLLPNEFTSYNIYYMSLGNNNITGTIPLQIFNLTDLSTFDLRDNNLEGGIPTEIGNISFLWNIYLEGNHLNGTVPTAIGALNHLKELTFANNDLTGDIPFEICQRGLDVVTADCLPTNNITEIQCAGDCCTQCCNRDGKDCIDLKEKN